MLRPRFFNMPADARSRLLDLAIREFAEKFAEKGFDEASLSETLARADISKGAYYYFDDEEDLFATAIASALDAMLGCLPIPALETLTRAEFWPAVERCVGQRLTMYDVVSNDLLKLTMHVDETRRRSPRFATVLAKAFWRTLVEAGQGLGCERTDLSHDQAIRLIEANDLVLDAMFFQQGSKLSRAAFQRHISLVFDTIKRFLVVAPPSSWPVPRETRPRRLG